MPKGPAPLPYRPLAGLLPRPAFDFKHRTDVALGVKVRNLAHSFGFGRLSTVNCCRKSPCEIIWAVRCSPVNDTGKVPSRPDRDLRTSQ
jgi:hypothetical protein